MSTTDSADPRAAEIDGGAGYFQTRSHVLMLCNSFKALGANVAALETRATMVRFQPTSVEVLTKIKSFATDDQVVRFLDEFHEAVPSFTLRMYCLLVDLKNAGMDWQRYALQEIDVPAKVVEIADLLDRFDADRERIAHYSGSRRDYYNWKPEATAYVQRRMAASPQPALKLVASSADDDRSRRSAP